MNPCQSQANIIEFSYLVEREERWTSQLKNLLNPFRAEGERTVDRLSGGGIRKIDKDKKPSQIIQEA